MSSIEPQGGERFPPLFEASSWGWTLGCGALKIAIAAAALTLPFVAGRAVAHPVGWMLLAGGAAEFALGWGAHRSMLGKMTLGSGVLTVIAGIFFMNSGWLGLFPLTGVTIVWLLLRGLISLDVGMQARGACHADWFWLVLRGFTDFGLGMTLVLGLPMATIAALLFNETQEMVSSFGVLLAISFAVAGVGLVVMGLTQRHREAAARAIAVPATA